MERDEEAERSGLIPLEGEYVSPREAIKRLQAIHLQRIESEPGLSGTLHQSAASVALDVDEAFEQAVNPLSS